MSNSEKRPLPPGFPPPEQETERLVLERLQTSATESDYFRWLLFAVGFYRGIQKIDSAKALLQLFLKSNTNAEQNAHCHLALGQIATDEQRFEIALGHFGAALELKPARKNIAYVLNNNMGYCLNTLGRYVEGERYCRQGIAIDSRRSSAYRNLGISLQGQGSPAGAAWALVEAIRADASDQRSRDLLNKLITANRSMVIECPWVVEALLSPTSAPAELKIV
jgi:tetratricopeptide (TPR) repeat protein